MASGRRSTQGNPCCSRKRNGTVGETMVKSRFAFLQYFWGQRALRSFSIRPSVLSLKSNRSLRAEKSRDPLAHTSLFVQADRADLESVMTDILDKAGVG